MKISISAIEVGERHRKNMGDLDTLARSLDEVGLLHPIVLTMEGKLVAGERRLRAAERLGWTVVDVRKVDISDPLRAERDENAERKPLAKSEAVAIAREIEAAEKAKAKERQAHGTTAPGRNAPADSAGALGDVRNAVAASVGMSHDTLAKATEVVEAAEQNPEAYGDLVEQMDQADKVDPFFRELRERRTAAGISNDPTPYDPLEERHCPRCGRDTPAWVLDGKRMPDGANAYRWLSRLGRKK